MINLNPSKIKPCLMDKRLTTIEKKILESYLLIRNNQNSEALKLLKELAQSELPFVEAQKNLLVGVSLNNQSHFSEAENYICRALPIFKSLGSQYFLFLGHFNLYFIYSNTRNLAKMLETIQEMESIPIDNEFQVIKLLRCQFDYYSEIDDIENSLKILKLIEPKKKAMPESDIISQLVCEFMFFVKQENFEKCSNVLTEMKKFRKFHLTENYNFMKKMLQHLIHGGPIYAYEEEFHEVPILFHQIKVIQSLEEKNINLAKTHWEFLKSSDSQIYQDHFIYGGTKSLFSLCLEKNRKDLSEPIQFEIQLGLSKLDSLIKILHEAKSPLPAPMIYEILWGSPPVDKQDLNKLTRLIYRAKNDKQLDIQFHKGTYSLAADKNIKRKVS